MIVLHDPTTLLHRTVELLGAKLIPALESPERIEAILSTLINSPTHSIKTIDFSTSSPEYRSTLEKLLKASHDPGYLEHLRSAHSDWVAAGLIKEDESLLPECFLVPTNLKKNPKPPKDVFARPGFYSFDMSSGIAKDTYRAIEASANLAVEASRCLASGASKSIVALTRPPGHHCTTSMTGGYCYVNNMVVSVHALREFTSRNARIAILDIDFHHGNGTQDVFYSDPSVLYLSIHGEDEYPYYSGFSEEVGEGEGEGCNFNYPLAVGSSFEKYLEKLEEAMGELVKFGPEFLLVSLGFDTFHLDPIGNFKIETEDYESMARAIRSTKGVAELPSAILLEGGYVIDRLGPNLVSFFKGWEDIPKDVGDGA